MPGGLAIGASNVASPCAPLAQDAGTPLAHTASTPLAHTTCAPHAYTGFAPLAPTACPPIPTPDDFIGAPRDGRSAPPADGTDLASLAIERCQALLSRRGEVSGPGLADEALATYRSLAPPAIIAFFDRLVSGWSSDPHDVRRSADAYCANPSAARLRHLQRATETPRLELFRRLNLASGGTDTLIEMRARLIRGLGDHPAWAIMETELDQLLRSWFNHGFLVCRRIDLRTPEAVLEKLVQYEAVHRIRDRHDLERRLGADRRCYALFHPSLPEDPVIFTELALTRGMSAKVQPLLDTGSPVLDAASCTSAIFYSISNCQDGLRGFSFGNFLIRKVVAELRAELPRLKAFATLSPVPGFRSWLAGVAASREGGRADNELDGLLARLDAADWYEDGARSAELERVLVPLCAHYLLRAKQGKEPADPVARFHLANGARLERINWLGDTSSAGMRRSAGMTVNYVYRLADLERNHEAYARHGRARAARGIESLCGSKDRPPIARRFEGQLR
jgi:malonyl-CoA decarboxylase